MFNKKHADKDKTKMMLQNVSQWLKISLQHWLYQLDFCYQANGKFFLGTFIERKCPEFLFST